ncbi:AraC family transcriptional regulator [Aliamphritea ceti]|uniref:AraC family transcriptional regulator n=1 Tax=Aliamphritea ceti TaxID=1524258 RepID=UPI0021C34D62|nr:AraC family transcriptional regulator [Aliamphritea ceti]
MATPQQIARINDVLHQIHKDITADLNGKQLAQVAAYSEQHLHRVFAEIVGESLHQYIRRSRLEVAANQLMFSPETAIVDIAEKCGFQSLSSFSRAFRATFGCAPGQWRKHLNTEDKPYLKDPEIAAAYCRLQDQHLPTPELIDLPAYRVAYIRHQGYGRNIRNSWQLLTAWAASQDISLLTTPDVQIGLHHSNPSRIPLEQCRYVACTAIEAPLRKAVPLKKRGIINEMIIPGGLHACFKLHGRYGELLPWISKIMEEWLPESGLVAKTTPAFAIYEKNHFLNKNEEFSLKFCLPVGFY